MLSLWSYMFPKFNCKKINADPTIKKETNFSNNYQKTSCEKIKFEKLANIKSYFECLGIIRTITHH